MKKFTVFSLCFLLSAFMLAACRREQSVHAGSEPEGYQPRPAPAVQQTTPSAELTGELVRVDLANKTITMRVENGMVQTFKFDDNTTVSGLATQPQTKTAKSRNISNVGVRSLVGKEGSEIIVLWRDDNGAKMATNIEVTQVSTGKGTRHDGRHQS
jgi:hypothetical protein